jgi:hypothetical protein
MKKNVGEGKNKVKDERRTERGGRESWLVGLGVLGG